MHAQTPVSHTLKTARLVRRHGSSTNPDADIRLFSNNDSKKTYSAERTFLQSLRHRFPCPSFCLCPSVQSSLLRGAGLLDCDRLVIISLERMRPLPLTRFDVADGRVTTLQGFERRSRRQHEEGGEKRDKEADLLGLHGLPMWCREGGG